MDATIERRISFVASPDRRQSLFGRRPRRGLRFSGNQQISATRPKLVGRKHHVFSRGGRRPAIHSRKRAFVLHRPDEVKATCTKAHPLHRVGFFFDKRKQAGAAGWGCRSSGAEENARRTQRGTPKVQRQPESCDPERPPVLRRFRPKPVRRHPRYRRGRLAGMRQNTLADRNLPHPRRTLP